jgi:hypothetical protein
VTLVRAEHFLINGTGEVFLEPIDVRPVERKALTPGPGPSEHGGEDRDRAPEEVIETEAVRALLALFRSGVDGLDARIVEKEADGELVFEFGRRPLATISVSPASFTVSLGDRAANPIVVSDRVSVERALNAVVSLFVRDGGREGEVAVPSEEGLSARERQELDDVWGEGVHPGERT